VGGCECAGLCVHNGFQWQTKHICLSTLCTSDMQSLCVSQSLHQQVEIHSHTHTHRHTQTHTHTHTQIHTHATLCISEPAHTGSIYLATLCSHSIFLSVYLSVSLDSQSVYLATLCSHSVYLRARPHRYGVALVGRIDKVTGLFGKRAL